MDQRLEQIKKYIRKAGNSWFGAVLLLAVAVLAATIAISAGKLKNVFNPDTFVTEEQEQSEFDPTGYGLQENDSQQGDEEGNRQQGQLFDQEDRQKRIRNLDARDAGIEYRSDDGAGEQTQRTVYVDKRTGDGIHTGSDPNGARQPAETPDGQGDGRQEKEDPQYDGDGTTLPEQPDVEEDPEEQDPEGTGEGEENPEEDDTEHGGTEQPEEDGEEGETTPDVVWIPEDITVSYYRNQDEVLFYKGQAPTEAYVRGNITVTSHWVEKGNREHTRTEEETDYTLEAIPEAFDHVLEDGDVNKSFTLDLTCQGITRTVACSVNNDYIRFVGMQVHYDSVPVFVTGETLYQGEQVNDAPIRDAIRLDVYGKTMMGNQDVYLPDETNYRVEFHEETGGVASKKADGSRWTANILYCGTGEETTVVLSETDAVEYDVKNYKLTVMYDDNTVLDTIYTDDRTVVLNSYYDGSCPYNEMIEKLRANGKFMITEEGYLTDLFYGWSSAYPASAENREISYTFKNGQHTQVMYAIPLQPLLQEGYLVKEEDGHQSLVGYIPDQEEETLTVPYGITRVAVNDAFQVSEGARCVRKLSLSAAVNSVDLSAAGGKFPLLEEYAVDVSEGAGEVNRIFSCEAGALYSADKTILWKLPSACREVTVHAAVEKIAAGAVADAAVAAGSRQEVLELTFLSDVPPVLERQEGTEILGGAEQSVRILVPETDGQSPVPDLVYKRYLSSWGEIFDEETGVRGAAARLIGTQDHAQERYRNDGNSVFSETEDGSSLAFVSSDEDVVYSVPDDISSIDPYAFAEPGTIRFVMMGDNVEALSGSCFASLSEERLRGVLIDGGQKIRLSGHIAGKDVPKGFRFYITEEQNLQSGWMERLSEDYGEDEAEMMLTIAEGDIWIDEQGCSYVKNTDDTASLTLCSVPSELEAYSVPEGYRVTAVGKGAFAWCSRLIYLELPDVTRVDEQAFAHCESLEILVLAQQQIEGLVHAFSGCDSLETLVIGSEEMEPEIPENTELLKGGRYFAENRIIYEKKGEDQYALLNLPSNVEGTVIWNDNVTEIGDVAFRGCSRLTSVGTDQMQKIRHIGEKAFYQCEKLKKVTIGTQCAQIGDQAFADCAKLEEVTWLGDTAHIGDRVFADNRGLKTVYFGDGGETDITTTGNRTFENCGSLQTVYIQAYLKKIGDYCFYNCENMKTSIAEKYAAACTAIGDYAFAGCSELSQTLVFFKNLTSIGEGAFMDCTFLQSMWIPSQLTEIPDYCFAGCSGMTQFMVLVDSQLESIGSYAFAGCTGLKELNNFDMLEQFRSIGDGAFSAAKAGEKDYAACRSLQSISLPAGIESIGSRAFAGCTGLKELDTRQAAVLTSLGGEAFSGCSSLTGGDFSRTMIRTLPEGVFSGCGALEILTLPETLESIGSRAMENCGKLSEVFLNGQEQVVSVEGNAFRGTKDNGVLSIYVPYTEEHALLRQYWEAWDWIWALTDLLSGQTVYTIIKDTAIGEDSFVENGGLYEIKSDGSYRLVQMIAASDNIFTVKENTTEIADGAFSDGSTLSVVDLPGSLTVLPEHVFETCTSLEVLLVKAGVRIEYPGSLFGEEETPEHFALWVSEQDKEYYDAWDGLPVRDYGIDAYLSGGALYGAQMAYDAPQIVLQYVPKSYEGELEILLGTTVVADGAARGCRRLTSVTSAFTVGEIGDAAFRNCTSLRNIDLTSLTSTSLTTIGDYAFAGCTSLTGCNGNEGDYNELFIPPTVEKLGKGMLKDCTSLTALSLQGRAGEIPEEMCSGCVNLKTMSLSRTLLDSVKVIDDRAFYRCESLTSLSWSNMTGLETVGESAYEGCSSLAQATFAGKLARLDDRCFQGTALEMLSFNGAEPPKLGEEIMDEAGQERVNVYVTAGEEGEIYFAYYNAWKDAYPTLASRIIAQDGDSFRAVNNILYMIDADSTEQLIAMRVPTTAVSAQLYNSSALYCVGLGDGSFRNCGRLTSLTIPNRVETIGRNVFENCTALRTVTIQGTALKTIDDEAFINCTSLSSLTLPETVYSLGDRVFAGCTDFRSLTVKSYTPFSIGSRIFGDSPDPSVRVIVPMSAYKKYMETWGVQFDEEYGADSGRQILKALSADGSEKIENGIHYIRTENGWEVKEKETLHADEKAGQNNPAATPEPALIREDPGQDPSGGADKPEAAKEEPESIAEDGAGEPSETGTEDRNAGSDPAETEESADKDMVKDPDSGSAGQDDTEESKGESGEASDAEEGQDESGEASDAEEGKDESSEASDTEEGRGESGEASDTEEGQGESGEASVAEEGQGESGKASVAEEGESSEASGAEESGHDRAAGRKSISQKEEDSGKEG